MLDLRGSGMKKPFSERWISDYFIGVFTREEINRMMDKANAKSLEIFDKSGEEVSWELIFENMVLVKQIKLGMETTRLYEEAQHG